jgi:signal transduction histidine kinase
MRSGRVEIVRGDVDLAELVTTAVGNVTALADAAGVHIDVHCPQVGLRADADRVVQALTNLLSNAVKFSPAGSTVEVLGDEVEDYARVRVCDQGRGIPAEKIDTIFERFEQVDAGDARDKGGTGLGLAITRHIVDAHGGHVTVDSEPGEGTTFTVVLPKQLEAS